ncbi:pregnancy-specific glycoprotein 22-like [Gastrophryne carolinensis]
MGRAERGLKYPFAWNVYSVYKGCSPKMWGSWMSPVRTLFLTVTLNCCLNSVDGLQIEVIPKNPKVGTNVTLRVTGVRGKIKFAAWYKGQSTDATEQILNYFPPEIKGKKYFPQAHGQANGSLVINDVRTDFDGFYTVQIQTDDSLQQGSVLLVVNGIVSIGLSPLVLLLCVLIFSDLNIL